MSPRLPMVFDTHRACLRTRTFCPLPHRPRLTGVLPAVEIVAAKRRPPLWVASPPERSVRRAQPMSLVAEAQQRCLGVLLADAGRMRPDPDACSRKHQIAKQQPRPVLMLDLHASTRIVTLGDLDDLV